MIKIQERKLNKTGRMRNKGRDVGIVKKYKTCQKRQMSFAKKEGTPETAHMYIGVMSPPFENQDTPRWHALVLEWTTNMPKWARW